MLSILRNQPMKVWSGGHDKVTVNVTAERTAGFRKQRQRRQDYPELVEWPRYRMVQPSSQL